MKLKRAIVIGYSMAGKLAAQVLSNFFDEVVVIEKDSKPESPSVRKGVPQSAHPHVLLRKGAELLEQLFPGILDELIHNGSVVFDFMKDVHWEHHGRKKVQAEGDFRQLCQSRPFLEWFIQKRQEQLPNVHVLYKAKADDFLWDQEGKAVIGLLLKKSDSQSSEELYSELVIDATGPAAFFKEAFKKCSNPVPKEETIHIQLSYTSQKIKWQQSNCDSWRALLLYPQPPQIQRGGVLYPIEMGEWMVSLFGYGEDEAPLNEEGFKGFAKSLPNQELFNALVQAQPVSELQRYRVSSQYRRRFDQMNRPPGGIIVIGDALCRFDPVFGQGMTASALSAVALQKVLETSNLNAMGSSLFSKKVYKKIMASLAPLWLMVISEDFMYRNTQGKRPFGLSVLQGYMKAIYRLTESDASVYQTFSRVLHLLDSPFKLFHPRILVKVLAVRRG